MSDARGSSEKARNRSLPEALLSTERKKEKKKIRQSTLNGALLLKVLRGISPFSSSSGTFWRTTWRVEREREREKERERMCTGKSVSKKKTKRWRAILKKNRRCRRHASFDFECQIRPVSLADRVVLRRYHAQDDAASLLAVRGRAETRENCSEERGLETERRPKKQTKASSSSWQRELRLPRTSARAPFPPRETPPTPP